MSDTTSRLSPTVFDSFKPRTRDVLASLQKTFSCRVMDDHGASLLHIPLKSKQGTLYSRDVRGNKAREGKGRGTAKKQKRRREKKHGRKWELTEQ